MLCTTVQLMLEKHVVRPLTRAFTDIGTPSEWVPKQDRDSETRVFWGF